MALTYIPFPSFTRSVMVLSDQHLSGVRNGSMAILYELWVTQGKSTDDQALRWRGHEGALIQYARATDEEWRLRRAERLEHGPVIDLWMMRNWLDGYRDLFPKASWNMPPWFGNTDFHRAERQLLCQLDPAFYDDLLELTTISSDNYRG